MAFFGTQPEGTGPLWRDTALQLTYVEWPHRVRGALSRAKAATGASIKYVLTGASSETRLSEEQHLVTGNIVGRVNWKREVDVPNGTEC